MIDNYVYWTVLVFRWNLFLIGWFYNTDSNLSYYASICIYLQTHIMTEQQLILLCPVLSNLSTFSLVIIKQPNGLDTILVHSFTFSSVKYSASPYEDVMLFFAGSCDYPLGMESGDVPDSAITASSSYVPNVGPHQGR
jgi:hypothetical protein